MTFEGGMPGPTGQDETINAIAAILRTMGADGGPTHNRPEPPFPGDRQAAHTEVPVSGTPAPREAVVSVEGRIQDAPRYDTISVFEGWGRDLEHVPDDDEMSPALRRFWEEYRMRGRVNVEIRHALEARGVLITESRHNTGHNAGQNEIVMNPWIRDKTLSEALQGITREAQAVPGEDIATYMQHQTLPVLAYIEGLAGGEGKFAIDTPEQVQRVAQLFADLPWARGQLGPLLKFKPIIETPSDKYTSLRVLVTAVGDVIGSGLLYSPEREDDVPDIQADPYYHSQNMADFFSDPHSPYYLNSRNITSNVSGGGGCIPLDPTERSRPITDEEQEILAAHGMQGQALPEPIRRAAQKIGLYLGGRGGLVYGLDFMLDTAGNAWFLEAGADPGVQTMNEVANGGAKDVEQGYRLLMTRAIDSVFPQR